MKILCLSDTHTFHNTIDFKQIEEDLREVETIVFAGDFTVRGTEEELNNFVSWLDKVPFPNKIVIPGNHDTNSQYQMQEAFDKIGAKFFIHESFMLNGIKFFASAYSPLYSKKFPAYSINVEEQKKLFYAIPRNTEVLITHTPAYSILDNIQFENAGSVPLYDVIKNMTSLRCHIFGHIHEAVGRADIEQDNYSYTAVNAAYCGRPYKNISKLRSWRVVDLSHYPKRKSDRE